MEYKASTQDWPSDDVVTHFQFCATMQLRTPFRILERHGETYWDRTKRPPIITREAWQGIWVPGTAFSDRMATTSMMASEIGPIPTNGSDFHRFLLVIRHIAETTAGVEKRYTAICAECERDPWTEIVNRLKGSTSIADQFTGRVRKT
ncbi:hypothetical protein [Pseudomonas prosekii]|uniref:Uncharacterized protein n=1 Tax=Pseudomonas prosekii TaxID=1148509 RepID=A0A1H2B329_9PSED|nr:hypothetical protein [Pseudomonas prosekii]SDT52196.1 hypothetical protein SAMN05216222_4865 [Pseudomonas prosekii]